MESRLGSASSGVGCSSGVRGQTLKSNPFCPRSCSKLTQSIIKDHMVSHYKKVYSAKAAVDASVPKSLIHSVKYNDQIRQERLRKSHRPQSANSISQRNSRASCSSAQSRLSVQYDDSPYLCSRSSTVSTPKLSSTFHAKEIVYSSYKGDSRNYHSYFLPASEVKYHSTEAPSHRKQSVCSLGASGAQSCYKTFQDPVQKTYSGDLLEKHSQHFTRDKPFTPKTLKSDKSSHLSQYRYYRAPQRKPTQNSTNSGLMRQETYHGSTNSKECTQELYESSQGFNTEHEWSEDEFNGTYLSASRQKSQTSKSRDYDFFDSSSRVTPEGRKSSYMKSISAEEEELMYLEFISAVTEDILSRGHISNRVLDRVSKRHIDMNRHHLDVSKMRHLLEVLRKDFEEPTNMSAFSTELENKTDPLDLFLPHLESVGKEVNTKKDNDPFSYASLIKYYDSPDFTDPLLVSTPLRSPETSAASPNKENEDELEEDQQRVISSSLLSEHVSVDAGIREVYHQNQLDTAETNEKDSNENHEYTTINTENGFDEDQAGGQELEDLGRILSESLHVSSNTPDNHVETVTEQHSNTAASDSDDEF